MSKNNVVDNEMAKKDLAGNLRIPEYEENEKDESKNNEFEKKLKEAFEFVSAYALCPLDGRYVQIAIKMKDYFSEFALVKYRVKVEILWLKYLVEQYHMVVGFEGNFMSIYDDFDDESFRRVKAIEKKTNHDVKAVEMFIVEKLKEMGYEKLISYVHIGCTSEDINNAAYAYMITTSMNEQWVPTASKLVDILYDLSVKYADVPMLAHTHGQEASPTTVGKEFGVYVNRLEKIMEQFENIPITVKFNGATGCYSCMEVAFPETDWESNNEYFVTNYLGFNFNPLTTQIENHDYICQVLDRIRNFNNIVLDLNWDMWTYISMKYFRQMVVKDEVGSSTMPHKVNPIMFENSISNIDTSNSLSMGLSNKLPVSRMQRDLSDSSSQRNIGLVLGYSIKALEQTIGGLSKVEINKKAINKDLKNAWAVLAEPIQTILRKNGVQDAYEQLKKLTRGKKITKKVIREFINSLDIPDDDKKELLRLTPKKYTGMAEEIVYTNLML